MPLNKNQLERLMYIDQVLASENGASTKEIAAHFSSAPVTLRTIQKDLVMLKEQFGHAIYEEGGRYHYEDKVNTLFNRGLSHDEKHLLLELMGVMGGLGNVFPNLADLEQRLRDEERRAGQTLDASERNILMFHSNPDYQGNELISKLFNYIYDKRLVKVEYQKFDSSRRVEYIMCPYLLKEYDSRWYLVGKNLTVMESGKKHDGNPFFSLPLDRIVELSPDVPERFKYEPEPSDLRERFEYIIGASYYQDNPEIDIVIAADAEVKDYIRTKPLCGSQKELTGQELQCARQKWPQFAGYSFFVLKKMKMNREMIQTLVKYFGSMVVVSPSDVSHELRDRTRRLLSLYDSLEDTPD